MHERVLSASGVGSITARFLRNDFGNIRGLFNYCDGVAQLDGTVLARGVQWWAYVSAMALSWK